jgi:hypothetical protein
MTRRLATPPVSNYAPKWTEVAAGDRLWVREAFYYDVAQVALAEPDGHPTCPEAYRYRATQGWTEGQPLSWEPPNAMPQRASRLTLVVTATRTERLHRIRNADIAAEGIEGEAPVLRFEMLWDQMMGYGSWITNPEVVVLSFDVHRLNVDAMR